jgi:hypothetical protein
VLQARSYHDQYYAEFFRARIPGWSVVTCLGYTNDHARSTRARIMLPGTSATRDLVCRASLSDAGENDIQVYEEET